MAPKYIENHYHQVLNRGLNLQNDTITEEGDIQDLVHDLPRLNASIDIAGEDQFRHNQTVLHVETPQDAAEGDSAVRVHVRDEVAVAVAIAEIISIEREGHPDPNPTLD